MNIPSITLIYFSPTGTTKTIVEEIAHGIHAERVEVIDCTKPSIRAEKPLTFRDELVILGAPVYSGRIPTEAADYFKTLSAQKTPAVLVAVYGNRAYEDALKELHDIAINAGFLPVAGGAFIGEHSFSSESAPIAHGRPDSTDVQKAREFGTKIKEKLQKIENSEGIGALHVPGNFPYRERTSLPKVAPVTDTAICNLCGECVSVCPTAAISKDDMTQTDEQKCIVCCACIKICSLDARKMENPFLQEVAGRLQKMCQERRESETYL